MTLISNQWIGYLQKSSVDNVQAQQVRDSQIAASGYQNVEAADDPVWAAALATNDQQTAQLSMFAKNQNSAQAQLSAADSALGGADSVLQNISSLAVQMGSDTSSAVDRSEAATELQALQASLVSFANSQNGGKYLFAGNQTSTAPFTATGTYVGDTGTQQVEVQPGEYVTANASGSQAFTASGGIDIFGAISALQTALQTNDGAGIRAQITTLSSAIDQVDAVRSTIGATIDQIQTAASQTQEQQTLVANVRAQSVEADAATAYSNLAQAQEAVTSSLTVASKMAGDTLLNYLPNL